MSRVGYRNTEGATSRQNQLFYGDNLDVLRRGKIARESVDLIYLDPPFNSQREWAVIFQEKNGADSASQQQAFLDSWDWSQASETYEELVTTGGRIADICVALHALFGPSSFLAYLSMMAARLVALHGVLKPTGSIYLHCDPTASHYLKMLMDAIFGPQNFRNEIIWKRAYTVKGNSGQGSKFFGPNTDSLLFYSKTDKYKFKPLFKGYTDKYLQKFYRFREPDGRRYRLISMIGPGGAAKGNPQYECMGVTKYWRYSRARMEELYASGMIVQTKPGAVPQRKQYLDTGKGVAVQTLWDDIEALSASSAERIGYPTQKPVALLARIIEATTDAGDTVLDPFCGCGTTISAAMAAERKWIGIDITARAIDIIVRRLKRDFPNRADDYKIEQYPYSILDALRLAEENKFHFQRWSLEKLGVDPSDIKPGADRGIDGVLRFAEPGAGRTKRVVLSVKGGQRVTPRDVRELRGVLDRDGFQIGVLVTAVEPTDAALADLNSGSKYYETSDGARYQRLQHISVEDLFNGRGVEYPDAAKKRVTILPGEEVKPEILAFDFDALPAEESPKYALSAPTPKAVMVKAILPLGFSQPKARKRR